MPNFIFFDNYILLGLIKSVFAEKLSIRNILTNTLRLKSTGASYRPRYPYMPCNGMINSKTLQNITVSIFCKILHWRILALYIFIYIFFYYFYDSHKPVFTRDCQTLGHIFPSLWSHFSEYLVTFFRY